ncbi:MAG: ribosome biogenesis GTPase Der, partial [Defluviitaleaceae bacterium]|nr:ribosome biogenesis GTPase Der [Defluviitaleaceae bacterium]
PGVTRDRIYADAEWLGRGYTLIDTGGLDPGSKDEIIKNVCRQAEAAIESADAIIFLTDVKTGVVDADREVALMLRRAQKPALLVVNKVDAPSTQSDGTYEFYELGLGDPMQISAGQALGIGDMLDEIFKLLPPGSDGEALDEKIKVAIVGRPNVGKSSLVNKLLGAERMIVGEKPGTTRDAVDSPFAKDGREFVLIDTAGLRRKNKIKENIERYGIVRAISAVERSDVCVIMIDATSGVAEQDAKIAGIAHERGKAAVIAVNKWDMVEKDDKTMREHEKNIRTELSYMPYAPMIFISALTGQRVGKLFSLVYAAFQNNAHRVATGLLNEVIIEAMAAHQPPQDKGRMLRVYYATQASVKPPTFVLFVNDGELMHFSYKRYLENKLREAFGFEGTPIHFIIRNRND